MKVLLKKMIWSIVLSGAMIFVLNFPVEALTPTGRDEYPVDPAAISDWFRNQYLVQQKNDLLEMSESNDRSNRPSNPATNTEAASQPVLTSEMAQAFSLSASIPDTGATAQWLTANAAASPWGLLESYPDDLSLAQQGFTYDQAVAGIAMLEEGNLQDAKKIFDFYSSQWDGTGFWTVYHTQLAGGNRVEYLKIMGPNAWVGIFSLHYFHKTGDPKGLELATKIGQWIRTLPHAEGGVAMGENNFSGHPNWGAIFSVENNLDYYALANALSFEAAEDSEKTAFQTEKDHLKQWFKTQAYNPSTRLFQRGMSDSFQSLDTNTWAILVFGVQGLKTDLGIDAGMLMAKAEAVFSVQEDGSFGGDPLSAKGFDFSDSVNAGSIGRGGVNWVEGTNHVVDVYRQLSDFYRQGADADASKADDYQARADYFSLKNAEKAVLKDGALGYWYADPSGEQVFYDNPFWKAAAGQSTASTAWAYFALKGINPFDLNFKPASGLFSGFQISLSTTSGMKDLFASVDEDRKVAMTWDHRNFLGDFDASDQSIRILNIPHAELGYTESLRLDFNRTQDPAGDIYSVKSFRIENAYADGSLYTHLLTFTGDGLVQSETFDQSLSGGVSSRNAAYDYLQIGGQDVVHTVDATVTFDGNYGYGSRFAYDYDGLGVLKSITVTQETRNDPLYRVLETYQLVFGLDGSTTIVYLDKQILPLS